MESWCRNLVSACATISEKFSHALGELNGDHSEVALAVYY